MYARRAQLGATVIGSIVTFVVSALVAAPSALAASSFTVNTTTDSATDTCATSSSPCSLRGAVIAADTAGGSSTITVPAGTYKLTIAATSADDPTNGDLDVTGSADITLAGAGSASTIIDATQIDRAFAVQSGAALSISGVTIENGLANGTSTSPYDGGAIYTDGKLSVSGSILNEDDAQQGGDIYADTGATSTTVTNSTLSNSFAGSTGSDNGGAIDLGGGSLTVTGDTFSSDSSYDNGGAIYEAGGPGVTITGSTFTADDSGSGGSIEDGDYPGTDAGGPIAISHSTFSSDAATNGDGGALDLDETTGNATVSDSTFSGDSDYNGIEIGEVATRPDATTDSTATQPSHEDAGGAIEADAGSGVTQTITGSTFTGDSAFAGGAISYGDEDSEFNGSGPAGDLTISTSRITTSNADYGGGVYLFGSGTVSIDHTTIDHNSAAYERGGGLDIGAAGAMTVSNTTISDNSAGLGGGVAFAIIYGESGSVPVQFTNDTIADNEAGDASCDPDCGGGFYQPEDAGGFTNTIIADNSGGNCDTAAGSADDGYNLDSDGSCFPATDGATGDQTDVNPLLGPLQDNGGPEPTQLPAAGSPAINHGTNTGCPSTDERGVPRPQGGTCDIGAVETAPAVLSLKDSAPATAAENVPFDDAITVSNAGPAPSGQTTVTETLPKGETLYGTTPSSAACTTSGSPVTVTCDLGSLAKGASATVTLVVAEADSGTVTNAASATNSEGSKASGSAKTKVTAPTTTTVGTPPKAVTGVSHVTRSTATIHGSVKTGNESTSYFFEYGKTKQYGHVTPVGKTSKAKSVSAGLSNLAAGTTYHYRLVAVNGTGHSFGRDRTFRTKGHSYLGKLLLDSKTLTVKNGEVYVPFTCDSSIPCHFRFSIDTTAEVDDTGQTGPVLVTESENVIHTIGAHDRETLLGKITPAAQALLQHDGGSFIAKLTTRPRSGQRGIISYVRIVQGS